MGESLLGTSHACRELFEGYYFCQAQREDFFQRAKPYKDHPTILRMQGLAKALGVVIPISFFEEANNAHYNSIAVIDADGTDLGLYRKSHIPDGPGYQEKFYFNPGDTGFKVFQTKFANIGIVEGLCFSYHFTGNKMDRKPESILAYILAGICWDQWFPEAARAMVLQAKKKAMSNCAVFMGSSKWESKLSFILVSSLQELFEGYYFCQAQREDFFQRAKPYKDHPTILRMQGLAKALGVVIPISFFEEANNAHYNSIAVIDADGTDLGLYRKSHIPDGPGYQEKFYFNPGDTGFKVFQTKFANIGIGICWDQWFPEAARAMVLQGAEILFYPTAIGSEPQDEGLDSRDHWKRVMQGHAGANVVPLVASNRIGKEIIQTEHGNSAITFYGNSFIAGPTGEIVAAADDKEEAVLVAKFDLSKIKSKRNSWGVFRDRRPDLYKVLLTMDGRNASL
ncbi:unnamed protein product [Ilex paraguariensis]|uniref:CN hydrolase domain-containing protein n=1 Tax=Ilex paraguariensis TaxID=185542 RepID=A0ABC8UDB6_9AQUA